MKKSEHKRNVDEAMANNDFESALSYSFDGYADTKENSSDDRIVFLRLIRGFAGKLLEGLAEDSKRVVAETPRCDFCGRDLKDSELTRGHSGTICNFCVDTIHENIHR